jgi:cystathionine gamma-synthase/methionine-gamma-lyase
MNKDTKSIGFSTRCVHSGEELDSQGGIHIPLYNHSTFGFSSTAELLDVVEGRKDGNLYTRYGLNPTIRALEKKAADLEDGELAYAFSSGMAAESATILAHCHSGDHIICIGDVYGGTYDLLSENLPCLGINTTFLLGSELELLKESFRDTTRIVFFETPTNPNLEILDIKVIAEISKSAGALIVIDNTFASPVNQKPLSLGADIVVHSATKYLGGHSDLTGGLVIGPENLLKPIWAWRKNLGQIMAPEVAFMLARSLRTLSVRVKVQNETAQAIAEFLNTHKKVKKVNYPGLQDFTGHHIAKKQMKGFGGMLSFAYDGDAQTTANVVDRLHIFSIAASLGGVESLVTQPITTTHHGMTPEERMKRGILDSTIRLSCGLEDSDDLINDLKQALDKP